MEPIHEALLTIVEGARPLPSETISLSQANGRYLASPIDARIAIPPFTNSAMDGYAVCAGDFEASQGLPVVLPCVGESRAGGNWPGSLPTRSALRIFTGAPLPAGADAVIGCFPAGVEAVVPALPVRSPGDVAEEAPARVSVPDPGLLATLGTVLAATLRLSLM